MKQFLNLLLGMLGIGATTAASDETTGTQKLQLQILGAGNPVEVRDPVPSIQIYGFASAPVPGAHHLVAFLGGNRTKGVAIASNDPRYRPTGLKPGESMMHNDVGMSIYLSKGGIIINGGGLPVTLKNGDLHVEGAVIAGYGTADQVGLQTHKHNQPPDSHNDTQQQTDAPSAGT